MLIYCNGKTKLHPLFYTSGKGYKYIQRWTITHDIYYVIIYLTKTKLKCRSTTQTTTHDSVACRTTSPCRDKRYCSYYVLFYFISALKTLYTTWLLQLYSHKNFFSMQVLSKYFDGCIGGQLNILPKDFWHAHCSRRGLNHQPFD